MNGASADEIRAALTPRQLQALQQYIRTSTYKEVAAALGIAPNTVKATIGPAIERLGARTLTHACALLVRAGLA